MTKARDTRSTSNTNKRTKKTMKKTTVREKKAQAVTKKQIEITKKHITNASNIDNAINAHAKSTMHAYITSGNGDAFGEELIELASIITHCKLNNLLEKDETFKKEFYKFKSDINNQKRYFECIKTLETLFKTSYNANGDIKVICIDNKRKQAIYKEIEKLSHWDGVDLVQDCILKLLQCIRDAESKGKTMTETLLLEPFEIYDLKSKTYSNNDIKPISLWTKHTTNAVKEASKAVSRTIHANRAIRETNALYIATETEVTDENGNTETIIKYKKACTLSACIITDMSGKPNMTVANDSDNELINGIPERANLTEPEKYIFKNHYIPHYYARKDEYGKPVKDSQGYTIYNYGTLSLEQIADIRGVNLTTVERQDKRLRAKIVNADVFPQYSADDIKTAKSPKKIRCYSANDPEKKTIAVFDGIREAARVLNLNAGHITSVLKGRLKSHGGLVFEYINK